jgi:hypothetical protein
MWAWGRSESVPQEQVLLVTTPEPPSRESKQIWEEREVFFGEEGSKIFGIQGGHFNSTSPKQPSFRFALSLPILYKRDLCCSKLSYQGILPTVIAIKIILLGAMEISTS